MDRTHTVEDAVTIVYIRDYSKEGMYRVVLAAFSVSDLRTVFMCWASVGHEVRRVKLTLGCRILHVYPCILSHKFIQGLTLTEDRPSIHCTVHRHS